MYVKQTIYVLHTIRVQPACCLVIEGCTIVDREDK